MPESLVCRPDAGRNDLASPPRPDVRELVRLRLRDAPTHGVCDVARDIVLFLAEHSDENGVCDVRVKDIVEGTGCCESAVHDYLISLRGKGWLYITYRPRGRRFSYTNIFRLRTEGRFWKRGEPIHKPRDRQRSSRAKGPANQTPFLPSSIAPPAVAASGLSEVSADLAVDDLAVLDEPAGLS